MAETMTRVQMEFVRGCNHGSYVRDVALPDDLAESSVLRSSCPACESPMIIWVHG